jgi:hypothetical protein
LKEFLKKIPQVKIYPADNEKGLFNKRPERAFNPGVFIFGRF